MIYSTIDPSSLKTEEIYKLLIATVVPRPIALVTTLSDNGEINCAPFSSFNLVASDPPTLLFSVYEKVGGGKKDTLINIERNSEFTVSVPSLDQARGVATCGASYSYGESEIKIAGFETVPSTRVKPPGVSGAHTQFECVLYQRVPVGDRATIVIGRIVEIRIVEEAWKERRVDETCLSPLGRLGGASYGGIGERLVVTSKIDKTL